MHTAFFFLIKTLIILYMCVCLCVKVRQVKNKKNDQVVVVIFEKKNHIVLSN